MQRFIRCALTVLSLGFAITTAATAVEAYPSRPIRIVVTSGAGGLLDAQTRLFAAKMSEKLGQPIVIENKPGADGLLAFNAVKSAPADGYTLLSTSDTIAIRAALKRDPGYSLEKDFVGVGVMSVVPLVLLAAEDKPFKTFPELVTAVKAQPGLLTYATEGNATTTHLASAILLNKMNLNMLHVPYKSNSAAMPDVASGRIDVKFSVAHQLNSGRLRALGVASTKRLPGLPNIPTLMEQGAPDLHYVPWFGLVTAAGVPEEVIRRLGAAMQDAAAHPDVQRRVRDDGGEERVVMSPEQFTQLIRQRKVDIEKLGTDLSWAKE
ncbi:tripartite tricarboxylate transporter substrate binding protein [Xylophilus sp. GW821-FHT01B05]